MHWSNFHDFCDFLHDIGLWIPFLLTVFSFRVNIFIDYLAHLRNKMHMPVHMHFISHKWGSRKQKWKSRHDCHQCRGCNLHLFLDLQYINFSVIKPSCIFYFTMTVNHPFLLFRGGRKVAIISLTRQIRSSISKRPLFRKKVVSYSGTCHQNDIAFGRPRAVVTFTKVHRAGKNKSNKKLMIKCCAERRKWGARKVVLFG